MNPDGTNRKQLTNNQGSNQGPTVSPDGRYIVFNSNRINSDPHVFRMDADGNNVKQLTNGLQMDGNGREWSQKISSDGKWVYYLQTPQMKLCKIPIDGGQPIVLATAPEGTRFDNFAVSPVNGLIAYRLIQQNRKIFIISPEGAPIRTIEFPPTATQGFFYWTPDGRAIVFNDSRNNWANIWSIPVDGSEKEKPLTNFTTERTTNFDWSPDGKQLLVIRNIETTNGVIISRAE
jgi:Tol biopolymer transport system component